MKGLTARQQEVLDTIIEFIEEHGLPPTVRELQALLGLRSTSSVTPHLRALERKGYLERSNMGSRNLVVPQLEKEKEVAGLPLVGTVPAGVPDLAEEHVEEYVTLEEFLGAKEGVFLLEVRGQSMRDAGILSGDLVAVDPRQSVGKGGIGVAWLDGEATVKHLTVNRSGVLLEPANPEFEPRRYSKKEAESLGFRVLGKVTGLVRRVG